MEHIKPRTASQLADENPELLLFSKHRDDTFFDVLDQPPAKPRLILTKNHPLFVKAMQCETVADLVDCLTRSCLDGRQGTNNPEAFTHVDPETAEMLALKAARLHVSTVFKAAKESYIKAQDRRLESNEVPSIYPNKRTAIIPVFQGDKRSGTMNVTDPSNAQFLVKGIPDPLAPVIEYKSFGMPHSDPTYLKALRDSITPDVREAEAARLRASMEEWLGSRYEHVEEES